MDSVCGIPRAEPKTDLDHGGKWLYHRTTAMLRQDSTHSQICQGRERFESILGQSGQGVLREIPGRER